MARIGGVAVNHGAGDSNVLIRVFVQARMSSRRFPGKVLAPFRGEPLIRHVIRAVERALPAVAIVVATSSDSSDDPLVSYLATLPVATFRGPLERVFDRFKLCLSAYPCEWILRVSADSPLLEPRVLQMVAGHADRPDCDLVTTIFPRTFPRGQNAELIRASTLLAIQEGELTMEDQEHVTPVFYRHPDRFAIVNVESGDARLAETSLAVDTVEDLSRLTQVHAL
jgi:spore coat polysaccharide biosynthesis protein SpsF